MQSSLELEQEEQLQESQERSKKGALLRSWLELIHLAASLPFQDSLTLPPHQTKLKESDMTLFQEPARENVLIIGLRLTISHLSSMQEISSESKVYQSEDHQEPSSLPPLILSNQKDGRMIKQKELFAFSAIAFETILLNSYPKSGALKISSFLMNN